MGALTINRKRADEVFSLYSPSPSASFNSSNCSFYSNQIDTKVVKKPRVSYLNQVPAAKAQVPSIVDRFQKYPKPLGKFKREVHAPCRSNRVGFLSNSSKGEVKPRVSETLEKANCIMGNVVGSAGRLWDNFKKKKDAAFGTFRHVTVSEVENETVVDVEVGVKRKEREVSKDSSEVVIIEDGIEVRSGVSDERRGFESKGLSLLVKSGDLDSKGLENSVVTDGNVLHSTSLGREAFYKELMSRVDQTYSPKLKGLGKEIETEWAILHRLRSLQTPKKEPEENLLQELFEPLSEEEVGEVKRALLNANRRKVFVTHENSNIQITGDILQCLRPGAWLNDEVINVYLELLKERERREPKKYLNCHFFNTFFYKKLIGGRNGYDYKAVRRWTSQRKLGYKLNECDKIFVPIHKEVHWCLAVINKKDNKFQYLDSLGGRDLQVLSVLGKYYADEVKDKCGEDIDVKSWKLEYVEDLPEQQNGFDCGVFMIKYADFYSRGMGLHFSQDNMPYFRQRTAKEILKLQAH